jgi:hypothetical protein
MVSKTGKSKKVIDLILDKKGKTSNIKAGKMGSKMKGMMDTEGKFEEKKENYQEESMIPVKFNGSLKSATDNMKCKKCDKVGCSGC